MKNIAARGTPSPSFGLRNKLADQWHYYNKKNGQVGPIDLQELQKVIGKLPNLDDFLVWRHGLANWRSIDGIPELNSGKRPPPPPPPEQPKPHDSDLKDPALAKKHMLSISAISSLVCAIPNAVIHTAPSGDLFTSRSLAFALGGALTLFAASWIAAGILYLVTLFRMSRDQLTFTAIVVQVVFAYFSYMGQR